jgi:nucleotide-binding universal stress UspA family protein
MKTILIPTENHDAMPAVLEAARLVARAFDGYMEGFAVHPSYATYASVDAVSGLAIGLYDADAPNQAQALFETFMQSHAVPPADPSRTVYSYGWPHADPAEDKFIGSYGRLFDLIVLGRPGRAPENPRMPPLETALFESGRPVLVVPPSAPKSLARNVLVAWNRSTEQARTNTFALPLLRQADKVTVLTVEGGAVSGPSADEAARHLRRNGVQATGLTIPGGPRTRGEVILDCAASLGCDLLVKSAYTESRLRQMIFGGATRHILANATLPVLMAH